MADISKIELPNGSEYNIKDANVPHSSLAAASGGTDLSLVTTGEKYNWDSSSSDTKVTQTNNTASGSHRLLFTTTANNDTETSGIDKNTYIQSQTGCTDGVSTSTQFKDGTRYNWTFYGNTSEIQLRNSVSAYPGVILSGDGVITADDIGCVTINKVNVGSSPEFTDAKVTQTASTDNANYEILFSGTNDNTTRTEGARKTNKLICNPDKGWLINKLTFADATKADNDVSADKWQAIIMATDKNGNVISTFENSVRTDGRVSSSLLVRNYDTSGAQVSGNKGITVYMDKSGNATYGVSDTANFRSAIGLTTTSPDYGITKTSGHWSIKAIDAYRYGNCVHMVITFNGDGTNISSGGTGFIGTIVTGPKPAVITRGFMLQGTVMGFVNIETDGKITAKAHTGTINLASTSNALVVFNFICP